MHLVPCLRCCQWITQQKDSNWWMLFSLANNVAWLGLLFFRIVDWFFSWESAWLGQLRVIRHKFRCVSHAFRKSQKKEKGSSFFQREISGLWKSERFRSHDTFLPRGRGWPLLKDKSWILFADSMFLMCPAVPTACSDDQFNNWALKKLLTNTLEEIPFFFKIKNAHPWVFNC